MSDAMNNRPTTARLRTAEVHMLPDSDNESYDDATIARQLAMEESKMKSKASTEALRPMTTRTRRRVEEDEAIAWQLQYEEDLAKHKQLDQYQPHLRYDLDGNNDHSSSTSVSGDFPQKTYSNNMNSSLGIPTTGISEYKLEYDSANAINISSNLRGSGNAMGSMGRSGSGAMNSGSAKGSGDQMVPSTTLTESTSKYSDIREDFQAADNDNQNSIMPEPPKQESNKSKFARWFSRKPKSNAKESSAKATGITMIHEPSIQSSDLAVEQLKKRSEVITSEPVKNDTQLPSINQKNHDFNRALAKWCQSVIDIHSKSNPDRVFYSKRMPNLEILMNDWRNPLGFEVANDNDDSDDAMWKRFKKKAFPSGPTTVGAQDILISMADLDSLELKDFIKICCLLVDIPVYENEQGKKSGDSKYLIESLHVLFSLYLEFKNSGHFSKVNH